MRLLGIVLFLVAAATCIRDEAAAVVAPDRDEDALAINGYLENRFPNMKLGKYGADVLKMLRWQHEEREDEDLRLLKEYQ